MSDDIRIWKCKHGHGLGVVQQNGAKIGRLMLYRNAIDVEVQNPAEVDIIAVIDSAIDIRCDICGEVRTWAPNQAAYERLMSHYQKSSHTETQSAQREPFEKKPEIASLRSQ